MNVEEMTAEELMEAAAAKAEEQSSVTSTTRTVEIDGVNVIIDTKRLQTWKAFQYIKTIDNGSAVEQVNAAVAFAEFVSDWSEEQIVEHLGGDDATTQAVVAFAMQIVSAAYPKN